MDSKTSCHAGTGRFRRYLGVGAKDSTARHPKFGGRAVASRYQRRRPIQQVQLGAHFAANYRTKSKQAGSQQKQAGWLGRFIEFDPVEAVGTATYGDRKAGKRIFTLSKGGRDICVLAAAEGPTTDGEFLGAPIHADDRIRRRAKKVHADKIENVASRIGNREYARAGACGTIETLPRARGEAGIFARVARGGGGVYKTLNAACTLIGVPIDVVA